LGDGRNGCTYTCKWEGGIEVVVKTPGKPGKEITKSEVKALKAVCSNISPLVSELLADKDGLGIDWRVLWTWMG